jgi:hypothetical protein
MTGRCAQIDGGAGVNLLVGLEGHGLGSSLVAIFGKMIVPDGHEVWRKLAIFKPYVAGRHTLCPYTAPTLRNQRCQCFCQAVTGLKTKLLQQPGVAKAPGLGVDL